jgi:hypothetical protein
MTEMLIIFCQICRGRGKIAGAGLIAVIKCGERKGSGICNGRQKLGNVLT